MSTAVNSFLLHDVVHDVQRQRQAEAAAHNRAARIVAARRWQKRAEVAARRARLARLAVQ